MIIDILPLFMKFIKTIKRNPSIKRYQLYFFNLLLLILLTLYKTNVISTSLVANVSTFNAYIVSLENIKHNHYEKIITILPQTDVNKTFCTIVLIDFKVVWPW